MDDGWGVVDIFSYMKFSAGAAAYSMEWDEHIDRILRRVDE